MVIGDRVTESDARGRARSPGNFNKDDTMLPSDGISRVRARELREAFGFNMEFDLPHRSTEHSESDDLFPPTDMEEGDNAGNAGLSSISDDEEDTSANGGGYYSADELVGRVGIPGDGRWEIRGISQDAIDYDRYIVTVGSKSGVVSIWWRKTEKSTHVESYLKAVDAMRRRYRDKKNALRTPNSYSISIHKFPKVFEKARRWQQWRSSWIYGFRLSIPDNTGSKV